MLKFEVLLNSLGEIGWAQVIIYFVLFYTSVGSGINNLFPVFAGYSPEKRCNVPPLDNQTAYPNLTEDEILNFTTPYDPSKGNYDGCYRYGFDLIACDEDLDCVNQSASIIKCDQGYHYDQSVMTKTIVTEFNLTCDNSYWNTIITSMYYVGMLIGSFLFGNFADLVGRKLCTTVTYTGMVACMIGLIFTHSVWLYTVLRMAIAGLCYGVTIGCFVYTMEITGEKWRTPVSMCFHATGAIGYMILGGIAYNWRNWHEIMAVGTILSSPFLIMIFLIPESPRWLFTKNKIEKGRQATKFMERFNRIKITEETWKRAQKSSEEKAEHVSTKHTFLDLFKRKRMRLITINIMFNWFVNSLVYYGLALNAGALAGDLFLNNTLNGVMDISSYIVCTILMDRVGRRLLISFYLLLAGFCLIINVIINAYAGVNQTLITVGVAFAFVGKFGISGSFAVIYNLTCELYPTVVRSNGLGIGSMASRVGGISAPFIILLQEYISWLPNTIFGVFGIVAGLLSLWFPETNKRPMMESLEEAEDFYKQWRTTGRILFDDEKLEYLNEAFEEKSTQL
ncbi:solute carrier family 22 member 16-like [Clavelina lepadiformis]|uniref:solute carrier family 22 member 16-like n=1 Tax=Clavelina lepadiformis TaxID=159417 RepID=UPI00404272AB